MRNKPYTPKEIFAFEAPKSSTSMRTKAFTLVEMLMVLALSAIVVAMIWAVYANMNLFALQFRKRLADSGRIMELDQYLRYDALRAINITPQNDQVCFEGPNFTGSTCYEFQPQFTLRRIPTKANEPINNPDTIHLGVRNWQIDSTDSKKLLHLTLTDDQPEAQPRLTYTVHLPAKATAQ